MKNNIGKKFCSIPWTEPYISARGTYGLCGIEDESYNKNKILISQDFQKHWNGDYIKSSRKEMLGGKLPPQCAICVKHEKIGKESMRQRKNLRYFGEKDPSNNNKKFLSYLEATNSDGEIKKEFIQEGFMFATGNLCQLGCVSCSSTYSSFLEREYEKLGYEYGFKDRRTPDELEIKISQLEINNYLYDILKSQIKGKKYLSITGGEPFLSKRLFEFLNWCVDNNYAKSLILLITTNGMNYEYEQLKVLKKFEYVIVMLSVDGYKEIDEYIRYPSKWEEKIKNFNFLKDNINKIIFASTVHSLNILSLDKLINYSKKNNIEIHLNLLEEPNFLHIKHLPNEQKKLVKERLEPFVKDNSCTVDFILKALNYNRNEHHWKQTIDVIKDIDNHRNLEFKKIEQTFNNLY